MRWLPTLALAVVVCLGADEASAWNDYEVYANNELNQNPGPAVAVGPLLLPHPSGNDVPGVHRQPAGSGRRNPNEVDRTNPNEVDRRNPNEVDRTNPNEVDRRNPNEIDRTNPNEVDRRNPNEIDRTNPNEIDRRNPNEVDRRYPNEVARRYPNEVDRKNPNEVNRTDPNRTRQRDPNGIRRRNPNKVDRRIPKERRREPKEERRREQNEYGRRSPNEVDRASPNAGDRRRPSEAGRRGPNEADRRNPNEVVRRVPGEGGGRCKGRKGRKGDAMGRRGNCTRSPGGGGHRYVCPARFVRSGSSCYYLSTNMASWQEAHFQCRDMDAELARLEKRWEDRNMRLYLNKPELALLERWIGGIYDWELKKWVWGASANVLGYQGFSRRRAQADHRWQCIAMDPALLYRWTPRGCLEPRHFLCETPLLETPPPAELERRRADAAATRRA